MNNLNHSLPKHYQASLPTRQRGMSLAEMMVGLVLGLIVVSAVFNTYVGSTRSADFSQGIQQLQENGRYGISTLQRGIRLAGYAPEGDLEPFDIAASSDEKIVVKVTDVFDCNGKDTSANDGIAINTYVHDAVKEIITCEGNGPGATPMPIVEGVEAMRFLWGIDADENDVVDHYVQHSAGINADRVIALRIALLVKSENQIRSRSTEEKHVLLFDELTKQDKHARHVFTSTVKLRNINTDWSEVL